MAMSQDTKDTLIKAGLYTGITLYFMNKAKNIFFGAPGSTARVPKSEINMHNTQVRRFITNNPKPGDYVEVEDKWTPEHLSAILHTSMSGVNQPQYFETDRSRAWAELSRQGIDRVRWLHNWWLDNMDGTDTIYRWIKGEVVFRWSQEHEDREKAKDMLRRAGVGF